MFTKQTTVSNASAFQFLNIPKNKTRTMIKMRVNLLLKKYISLYVSLSLYCQIRRSEKGINVLLKY